MGTSGNRFVRRARETQYRALTPTSVYVPTPAISPPVVPRVTLLHRSRPRNVPSKASPGAPIPRRPPWRPTSTRVASAVYAP